MWPRSSREVAAGKEVSSASRRTRGLVKTIEAPTGTDAGHALPGFVAWVPRWIPQQQIPPERRVQAGPLVAAAPHGAVDRAWHEDPHAKRSEEQVIGQPGGAEHHERVPIVQALQRVRE